MSDEKLVIVAKIQKLLALAKSSNQHEAELAASRASELMAKYQIEAAEVETVEIRSGRDAVVRDEYIVAGQKMKLIWIETLASACAKLFDGMILIRTHQLHGTSFTFVGFKSDIPLMRSLFEHLYGAWFGIVESDLAAAKRKHEEVWAEGTWAPRNTMKFKVGHGLGYATALFYRCTGLAAERKKKVAAASNTCNALVLVREGAVVQWKKDNGVTSVNRSASSGSSDGRAAGARAGWSVPMGGSLK